MLDEHISILATFLQFTNTSEEVSAMYFELSYIKMSVCWFVRMMVSFSWNVGKGVNLKLWKLYSDDMGICNITNDGANLMSI